MGRMVMGVLDWGPHVVLLLLFLLNLLHTYMQPKGLWYKHPSDARPYPLPHRDMALPSCIPATTFSLVHGYFPFFPAFLLFCPFEKNPPLLLVAVLVSNQQECEERGGDSSLIRSPAMAVSTVICRCLCHRLRHEENSNLIVRRGVK